MSSLHDPRTGLTLALPPIALSELKEPTKDFLLANANHGKTPAQTMKELLDRGASRAGFGGDDSTSTPSNTNNP
jgi:hypothetical protein